MLKRELDIIAELGDIELVYEINKLHKAKELMGLNDE